MPEVWVLLTVVAAALAAAGYFLFARRSAPAPPAFADPREERLARQVAGVVGCPPEAALPAVRRELELSPGQSDETLAKRAAYHYRQDLPETTCRTYHDAAAG